MKADNDKPNKGLIIGIVAAVAVVAAVGIFAVTSRDTEAPQFVTAAAKIGDVEDAVLATGTLQPAEVVNVGAQATGQITSMSVKLGDTVQPGQMIAVIESFQLENQVRQAEQQINQTASQINTATAGVNLQTSNLAREESLMSKGVGTQAKLDQARNQLTNARANLVQQESTLKDRELALENARNNLDKTNVRAPMAGVVAELIAREGQTISNQQQVPIIVKLAKMDVMTVRAQISEADIIKVTPGQRVYFTILGDPTRRYNATLRTRELTPAGGALDPSGGGVQKGAIYYNALFEVANDDGVLFPGMTAEVHVVLNEARGVLTIPSAALGARGSDGRYTVRVVGPDGKAVERKVLIGLNNNSVVEIKDGLKAGDNVVIGEAGAAEEAPASGGGAGLFGGLGAPS